MMDNGLTEQPKTVLIAEADVFTRLVLADHLRECGFDVIEAANACDAIQALRHGMPIDILLADVRMPGEMNGFGLAKWIRQQYPEVRIIITSGVDRAARQASDLCAAERYGAKPCDPAAMAAEIRRLTGGW